MKALRFHSTMPFKVSLQYYPWSTTGAAMQDILNLSKDDLFAMNQYILLSCKRSTRPLSGSVSSRRPGRLGVTVAPGMTPAVNWAL